MAEYLFGVARISGRRMNRKHRTGRQAVEAARIYLQCLLLQLYLSYPQTVQKEM